MKSKRLLFTFLEEDIKDTVYISRGSHVRILYTFLDEITEGYCIHF